MGSLACPLCCNETFNSHLTLKCHLLSVIENTICPSCNGKFEKISELIEHLENDCSRHRDTVLDEQLVNENDDINQSILAKALLNKEDDEVMQVDNEIDEGNNGQYFCQMCNLNFDDIEEHLEKFHEGQEVILETEDADEISTTNSSELAVENDNFFVINSFPVTEDMNATDNSLKNVNSSIKLDTITEKNLRDKDGRLYTRKLVKIDKFWLDPAPIKDSIVQKYVMENGKVRKISLEEAESIENKDTIIEIYECPDCNLLFPVIETYKKHKCTDISSKCSECNAHFINANALKAHMRTHVKKLIELPTSKSDDDNNKTFNCETCNTTFPTSKSLRLHRRMHEPIKSKEVEAPVSYNLTGVAADNPREMFVCKICNKTYDKQYEIIHMKSHSNESNFICDICNRKFFTQSNLDMHMKAHSNNKKFACSYCKKTFVTYDSLNDHLLNQCQQRQYACQFCGRRFVRPHEKVKHERIHTGEKPHICEICGKSFRVSYCLTLHMRTHSGTRPYQCRYCGKRFKSHSVYNHHLLTHSDVRAYKCPYCPKAFKTSVQLAGHKNSHIKPFTCTECNRPFSSLYTVRAHMETHKRDNNLKYECWICGALYSRAFALKDHLKDQHQQLSDDDDGGNKAKTLVLTVEEEIDAANSILVKTEDVIVGFDDATGNNTSHVEIIENEIE